LLVAKNHPADIAAAIRRALADDALVDAAAETNRRLMLDRLDISRVKPKVVQMYRDIAGNGGAQQ
jgi:hypothetical protein